jgi:hypothetical protein
VNYKLKAMAVKTKADAIEALEESVALKGAAEELMREHGITEMLEAADDLKKKATSFAAAKGIDKLDLSDGRYGKLITAVHERVWVGTKDDMPDNVAGDVKPLKSLVSKEVWMKITKRVPDPERIEQAVGEGLVTLDEIEPAYFEKMRAPFIRVFGGSNGE